MAFLGIDLGGTYARAAVVDAGGAILASAKRMLADRTPEGVVETLGQAAEEVLGAYPQVTTCGVGVAGMLEGESGVVAVGPNLGWRQVPFGALLATRLGRTVRVVNDLSAAAWGEFTAGAGRGGRDLFVVFVGSGVGGAMICNGQLVRGATGAAGEFGHVKVVPEGRLCGCGERGCLEAYAGGHNLIAQMQELLDSGRATSLRALAEASGALTPTLLEEAALAGDPAARELYEPALAHLGLAVANQVTVFNPHTLVLGGGVLFRCPRMRRAVAEGVERFASAVSLRSLRIADAALGDDSGVIGAALLGGGSTLPV